ncbi:hypothetical protein BS50DRAFT_573335 [Corynespora cassiicola Philippines]|uniref:Uncharacterized protein n=1 Tax=Corynespora cassiicola Philippines TaxID=1448308 RepID=A0A2T2NTM3_CORCC|nr:hypothetical protein BS50DRAFT_573335 [Corynespora cassiicola Philippines]
MLSLPLIPPRADASLWPSHRTSNFFDTPSTDSQSPHSNGHNRRPGSHHGGQNNQSRSMLTSLTADENIIDQRKQNVRRFGAGWIRPPGVAKTYQALMDEKYEREEQEVLARREQVMLDLQAAQQETANEEERAQNEEDEDMMGGERDLDDDVPEAEADESDISDSDESASVTASEAEEGDTSAIAETTGDMTFNEDSFIEGSMVQDEVEHMLEMEEAEMAGVLQDERDLDDDIPEAGSYEHTDSELVDSSSEDDVSRGPGLPSSGRRTSGRRTSGRRSSGIPGIPGIPGGQRGNRSSFGVDGSSSIMEGSSFLRSSPAATRGSLRARFMGARSGRGT